MIKNKYIQALDKSVLLLSYCESGSELDQGLIELLADSEEFSSTLNHENNFKADHKFEKPKFNWKKNV